MTTLNNQRDAWVEQAKKLGEEQAKSAATWATDANSDVDERKRVLQMLRDGDGAAYDYLPRQPDLSGEFADDLNPAKLYVEITGHIAETDAEAVDAIALADALAEAYEEGASETFTLACEAELIRFLRVGRNAGRPPASARRTCADESKSREVQECASRECK